MNKTFLGTFKYSLKTHTTRWYNRMSEVTCWGWDNCAQTWKEREQGMQYSRVDVWGRRDKKPKA